MNYEEKYRKALSFLKDLKPHMSDYCIEKLDGFFPELKESEDEMIRKTLIRIYKKADMGGEIFGEGITYKQVISWLEKQGEKKDTVIPQWMIDFLKEHRRNFATPMDYDEKKETDGKLISVIKWLEGNPQLEQKPSWSEEDEEMIDFMIEFIESLWWRKDLTKRKDEVLSWLKSIHPHWKPSEEQMEALKKRTHGLHESSETRKALESLINDLKTL